MKLLATMVMISWKSISPRCTWRLQCNPQRELGGQGTQNAAALHCLKADPLQNGIKPSLPRRG